MARIRSIKPEFWKSEDIARLPLRTRLTFIGLWSYVDDNGVGRDVEKLIAAELYPLEDDPREALAWVREDLATLSRESRVVRYTVEGKPYLSISNWSTHQRIDKPNKARYPEPEAADPPLTSSYGDPRDTLATPSRHPRESPAPGAVEVGTGEQGNRGQDTSSPLRADADRDFDEWWSHYPRKVGKVAAAKAYGKARGKIGQAPLLAAVVRFSTDPNLPDTEFVCHPATWLNEGRWDDDPLPARRGTSRNDQTERVLRDAMARAQAAETSRLEIA